MGLFKTKREKATITLINTSESINRGEWDARHLLDKNITIVSFGSEQNRKIHRVNTLKTYCEDFLKENSDDNYEEVRFTKAICDFYLGDLEKAHDYIITRPAVNSFEENIFTLINILYGDFEEAHVSYFPHIYYEGSYRSNEDLKDDLDNKLCVLMSYPKRFPIDYYMHYPYDGSKNFFSVTLSMTDIDKYYHPLHKNQPPGNARGNLLGIQPPYLSFIRAESLHARGKYELAIQDYNKALKDSPSLKLAIYKRGHCLLKLGKFFTALDDFDKVKKGFSFAETWHEFILHAFGLEQKTIFENKFTLEPTFNKELFLKHEGQVVFDGEEMIYGTINLAANTEYTPHPIINAILNISLKLYAEAINDLQLIFTNYQDQINNPNFYFLLGRAYFLNNQLDMAFLNFCKATALAQENNPFDDHQRITLSLVNTINTLTDPQQMILTTLEIPGLNSFLTFLNKSILDNDNTILKVTKALVLYRLAKEQPANTAPFLNEAQTILTALISTHPNKGLYYYYLSLIEYDMGLYKEAISNIIAASRTTSPALHAKEKMYELMSTIDDDFSSYIENNETLLHFACANDQAEMVTLLLKNAQEKLDDKKLLAFLLAKNADNKTALMLSLEQTPPTVNIVDQLITLTLKVKSSQAHSSTFLNNNLFSQIKQKVAPAPPSNLPTQAAPSENKPNKISPKEQVIKVCDDFLTTGVTPKNEAQITEIFDDDNFDKTVQEYETTISEGEKAVTKAENTLTDADKKEIAKLPASWGETIKLSLAKFLHDISPGQNLDLYLNITNTSSKLTSIEWALTHFLNSGFIGEKSSYIPEAIELIKLAVNIYSDKGSITAEEIGELTKKIHLQAKLGSFFRIASGSVAAICELLEIRSFIDIINPTATLYSCWIDYSFGPPKPASAKKDEKDKTDKEKMEEKKEDKARRIAGELISLSKTIRHRESAANKSLKEYAIDMCNMSISLKSAVTHQAALLLIIDLEPYFEKANALPPNEAEKLIQKLLSGLLFKIGVYHTKDKVEPAVQKAINAIGLYTIRSTTNEDYKRHKMILSICENIAKEENDPKLAEITKTARTYIEDISHDKSSQDKDTYIAFIKLFARCLIELNEKNNSALSYLGILCYVSAELYSVKRSFTKEQNRFEKGRLLLSCIKKSLNAYTGILSKVPDKKAFILACRLEAIMLVSETVFDILSKTAPLKTLTIDGLVTITRNALDGKAQQVKGINNNNNDDVINKISSLLNSLTHACNGFALAKSVVDFACTPYGWNILKRARNILPESKNGAKNLIDIAIKAGDKSPKALTDVCNTIISPGASLPNTYTTTLITANALASLANFGATVYYGRKTDKKLTILSEDNKANHDDIIGKINTLSKSITKQLSEQSQEITGTINDAFVLLQGSYYDLQNGQERLYNIAIDFGIKDKIVEQEARFRKLIRKNREIGISDTHVQPSTVASLFDELLPLLLPATGSGGTNIYNQYITGRKIFEDFNERPYKISKILHLQPFEFLDLTRLYLNNIALNPGLGSLKLDSIMPNLKHWLLLTRYLIEFLCLANHDDLLKANFDYEELYEIISYDIKIVDFLNYLSKPDLIEKLFNLTIKKEITNDQLYQNIFDVAIYSSLNGVELTGFGEPELLLTENSDSGRFWRKRLNNSLSNTQPPLYSSVNNTKQLVKANIRHLTHITIELFTDYKNRYEDNEKLKLSVENVENHIKELNALLENELALDKTQNSETNIETKYAHLFAESGLFKKTPSSTIETDGAISAPNIKLNPTQ